MRMLRVTYTDGSFEDVACTGYQVRDGALHTDAGFHIPLATVHAYEEIG